MFPLILEASHNLHLDVCNYYRYLLFFLRLNTELYGIEIITGWNKNVTCLQLSSMAFWASPNKAQVRTSEQRREIDDDDDKWAGKKDFENEQEKKTN